MVPSYEFDICWLIPREVEADPAIGELLGDIGFNPASRGNYIALFRDPQVVAMIERADPVLREFLKSCGFGFSSYHSGTPAGFYPAGDDAARADVVARLEQNLCDFDLQGADLGGFEVGFLMKAILEGRPMPADADTMASERMSREQPERARGEVSEMSSATATAEDATRDVFAMPVSFARLSGRNRVLPLMVASLAVTLGAYWLIEHFGASAPGF